VSHGNVLIQVTHGESWNDSKWMMNECAALRFLSWTVLSPVPFGGHSRLIAHEKALNGTALMDSPISLSPKRKDRSFVALRFGNILLDTIFASFEGRKLGSLCSKDLDAGSPRLRPPSPQLSACTAPSLKEERGAKLSLAKRSAQ
jgi:hypothetical protein